MPEWHTKDAEPIEREKAAATTQKTHGCGPRFNQDFCPFHFEQKKVPVAPLKNIPISGTFAFEFPVYAVYVVAAYSRITAECSMDEN